MAGCDHIRWYDAQFDAESRSHRGPLVTSLPDEYAEALQECDLTDFNWALREMNVGYERHPHPLRPAWERHIDRIRAAKAVEVFHLALDLHEFLNPDEPAAA